MKDCALTDIQCLRELTELTMLDIDRNRIRDLQPVSTLTGLMFLNCSHNRIEDISPLMGLRSLRGVDLRNNPLNSRSRNVLIPQLTEQNPEITIEYTQ